jgi:hypothetical protein
LRTTALCCCLGTECTNTSHPLSQESRTSKLPDQERKCLCATSTACSTFKLLREPLSANCKDQCRSFAVNIFIVLPRPPRWFRGCMNEKLPVIATSSHRRYTIRTSPITLYFVLPAKMRRTTRSHLRSLFISASISSSIVSQAYASTQFSFFEHSSCNAGTAFYQITDPNPLTSDMNCHQMPSGSVAIYIDDIDDGCTRMYSTCVTAWIYWRDALLRWPLTADH